MDPNQETSSATTPTPGSEETSNTQGKIIK